MAVIKIQADSSRDLTIKVLMYLSRCQEQGLSPTSIKYTTDNDYPYSVTIVTKEVQHDESRTSISLR